MHRLTIRLLLCVLTVSLGGGAPVAAQTPQPQCADPSPLNRCIPGGGPTSTDCNLEFLTNPVPALTQRGAPRNRSICYEGDPRCDLDPDLDNASCTFRVALCINNTDARFPNCVPLGTDSFEVKSPNPSRLKDAADQTNLDVLESVAHSGFGLTVSRQNVPQLVGAPNSTPNLCGTDFDIVVPLRQRPGGKLLRSTRTLRLRATTTLGQRDTDTLSLECRPSTCGNGLIEPDHETCDDGNRQPGDGCDSACRIEPPTATPSVTSTATPSVTATATTTPVPTATPTSSPSRTRTLTASPTPTWSLSPTSTLPPAPTLTWSPSPTSTLPPSPTATSLPSPTSTLPPSPTATSLPSPTGTSPPSPTATLLPSPTNTLPPSPTPTSSPPPTVTSTASPTPIPQPCNPDSESYSEPAFYRSLAYRWAPIIIQDTASKWNADFIGKINYDNDWRSNNNWDNLPSAGIAPYLYYDVVETSTHWFIHYHTFHPRDWDNVFFGGCAPFSDCHENDTENLFMMIQKDGSTYGRFRLMETEAHTSFYQYALANDGVSSGTGPDADGLDNDAERGFTLFTDSSVGVNDPRPAIYIESKGHGICDWWDNNGPYCTHSDDTVPGGDGVMYYPSATATPSVPPNPSGGLWSNFKSPYNLISIWDDVWVLRSCLGNGMTFDSPFTYPGVTGNGSPYIGGAMDGDDYTADAATAWWAQNHGNLAPGDWTMDSARTVLRQLTFSEPVDTTYLFNPYLGIH